MSQEPKRRGLSFLRRSSSVKNRQNISNDQKIVPLVSGEAKKKGGASASSTRKRNIFSLPTKKPAPSQSMQESSSCLSCDDDASNGGDVKVVGGGKFDEPMSRLTYTQNDIVNLVGDDDVFRTLQDMLRHRGCVTNSFLQQHVHLYVRSVKEMQEDRMYRPLATSDD